eukprot:g21973.t1
MTAGAARADEITYRDMDGKTVTVSARIAGSGQGQMALELADGSMRLIPEGAMTKRVPADPPKPITHEQMAEKLKKQFGEKLVRTYIDKPFVIAVVLGAPLESKNERRCEAFLKKGGRYLGAMERVFKAFAKRYKLPQHEPRFPLVMLVFESDDDFEKYTGRTTKGPALSSKNIAGFYSSLTNWLAIRLNECHDFDTPLHEAIHQQVFNRGITQRFSPAPTWFQEGIATGFAGDGNRISIAPNKVSTRFARRAYKSRRINWATVVVDDSPFRGNDLAGDAYTHAWGMHWLLVTKYKKQYTEYVKKLSKKKMLSADTRDVREREFRETFGKTAAELQASFPAVLESAVRRERIKLTDPNPPGVGNVKMRLADVAISATSVNGVVVAHGRLFNISPIRPMTFHVTIETNSGTYAEWLVPELTNRSSISLKRQVAQKLMKNARGGAARSFHVRVRSAVPGTETEKRWRSGQLPVPTKLNVPVRDLVAMAAELGYSTICMRASGAGVQTPRDERQRIRAEIEEAGLRVSMITADFDVPLNNEDGPNSLRAIGPSLDVAEDFGCDLIRVCLKKEEDVEHAKRAADLAAERDIRLAHQCHTTSLFEEVDPSVALLQRIGRDNFGLIYEPANLMLCGQPYDESALRKFKPYLMNVYVQNHVVDPAGPVELPTYCLGPRRFRHIALWEPGGVDYASVFAGLQAIGYNGTLTVHQAQNTETLDDARDYASRCAEWFREMT